MIYIGLTFALLAIGFMLSEYKLKSQRDKRLKGYKHGKSKT